MLPKATGREAALEKKAARRQEARPTLSYPIPRDARTQPRVWNPLQAVAHSAQRQDLSVYRGTLAEAGYTGVTSMASQAPALVWAQTVPWAPATAEPWTFA
jgi:hypothetical protein